MEDLTKYQAREIARNNLSAMTASQVLEQSQAICKSLIANINFESIKNVLLYKALPKEVNVDMLINHCVKIGKRVFLPRVNGQDMEIAPLNDKFTKGCFGILEPVGESVNVDIDLAIIPLLAIDKQLTRLGKGKGYYDKFLANSNAKKVAVAFSQQIFDILPKDKHDIDMDICFTDKEIILKGEVT